jgi:hypothetical protein
MGIWRDAKALVAVKLPNSRRKQVDLFMDFPRSLPENE